MKVPTTNARPVPAQSEVLDRLLIPVECLR
jgi:hypothetical protein